MPAIPEAKRKGSDAEFVRRRRHLNVKNVLDLANPFLYAIRQQRTAGTLTTFSMNTTFRAASPSRKTWTYDSVIRIKD